MSLISLHKVSLAFGHTPLLDQLDMKIESGERVCLLGRNGAGKSSLLKVIAGEIEVDEGEIRCADTLKIACLQQDVPEGSEQLVSEMVASGLGHIGDLLNEYRQLSGQGNDKLKQLDKIQGEIDLLDGWNIKQKVETVLDRLSLDGNIPFSSCSGGTRRRVMLAQALVGEPDLLLLDEPTNHLDIESIRWLEDFLISFRGTLLFITHDRSLLHHLASRIIELDRGQVISCPGDYKLYLQRKQQELETEERANRKFDKKLSEYETWVRKGIKARRTRNEGKVRKLQEMRRLRQQRLERESVTSFQLDAGRDSGKLVVDAENISFQYNGQAVISDFSSRIMRGDRIGIIGANGCGKSTLVKLLLGQLQPASGKIHRGSNVQVAYFDQQREQLDEDKSLRDNIAYSSDYVSINGQSRHIISYMQDFLFSPERINSPVRSLSGGERNRLLLARIFTQPANLLVLDEPTNDLDIETLELLEELLSDYKGTLLLVSHDRYFLDRVVGSTIVFEGQAQLREYVGGYEDWQRQRASHSPEKNDIPPKKTGRKKGNSKKPGYREKRELEKLPALIEELEQQKTELEEEISHADFYQQDTETITGSLNRLKDLNRQLEQSYERWQELESLQAGPA